MFLLYIALYLVIGFVIDWSMSVDTKVQLWSVLAWPFLLGLTMVIYIRDLWRKKNDLSDM